MFTRLIYKRGIIISFNNNYIETNKYLAKSYPAANKEMRN